MLAARLFMFPAMYTFHINYPPRGQLAILLCPGRCSPFLDIFRANPSFVGDVFESRAS